MSKVDLSELRRSPDYKGTKKVLRKGKGIMVGGRNYRNPALDPFAGRKVHVLQNLTTGGITVYDRDGELVCVATRQRLLEID